MTIDFEEFHIPERKERTVVKGSEWMKDDKKPWAMLKAEKLVNIELGGYCE